jgi:hypothetical protein
MEAPAWVAVLITRHGQKRFRSAPKTRTCVLVWVGTFARLSGPHSASHDEEKGSGTMNLRTGELFSLHEQAEDTPCQSAQQHTVERNRA